MRSLLKQPVPKASTSRLAPVAYNRSLRSYGTQSGDFGASSNQVAADRIQGRAEKIDANSSLASGRPDQAPRQSAGKSTGIEATKTLALARWSALKESALLAIERRQQELRERLVHASATINDVTGYKEIERLKQEVTRTELELLEARQAAKDAKQQHANALNERMLSSREVNDLLQRKNSWLDSDVLRFTELVRQDHLNEQKERDSKIEASREEETVERKIGEMMQAILRRYHEEQVWSDKIRSLSTYGTLAITSINVLIFLLALILVEPWKRRRMVTEVEGRIKERDEHNKDQLDQNLKAMMSMLQGGFATTSMSSASTQEVPVLSAPSGPSETINMTLTASGEIEDSSEHAVNFSFPTAEEELNAIQPGMLALREEGSVDAGTSNTRPGDGAKSQPNRDAWYAGVGGSLVGAAAVTVYHALFR